MSGLERRIVTLWQEILSALGIRKYRPAWMITHRAFMHLCDDFYSRASTHARFHLLPEQEEALQLLAHPSYNFGEVWVEVE